MRILDTQTIKMLQAERSAYIGSVYDCHPSRSCDGVGGPWTAEDRRWRQQLVFELHGLGAQLVVGCNPTDLFAEVR